MVSKPEIQSSYPPSMDTTALRSLFDNLASSPAPEVHDAPAASGNEAHASSREVMALALDRALRRVKKADWRGNRLKEREVRNAIKSQVGDDVSLVDSIFEIVKAQSDY